MVEVVLHEDGVAFAPLVEEFYARDPDRHTIALSVLDGIVRHGDPAAALATVQAGGDVVGALLCSPGRPAVVSGVAPDQAALLVEVLAGAGFRATGARGPTAATEAYAAAHLARHGGRSRISMATRLFALDKLVPPEGVAGCARPAVVADAELLYPWQVAFLAESPPTGEVGPTRESIEEWIARSNGGDRIWTVDGLPVAHAAARMPAAGMSRIGPVYTPPEHRRHGYGAAATASAAQWALDQGARRVVLFTDLSNPVSNRLYPRLGFAPVYDGLDLAFVE